MMWSNAKNKNIHVIYTIRRSRHLPSGCAHVQTKGYEQSLREKRGHSCITNVSTCEQERVVTNIQRSNRMQMLYNYCCF